MRSFRWLSCAIVTSLLYLVSPAIHPDGRSVVDQTLMCRSGQAISDIWWFHEAKTYNTYYFECQNVTDSCQEKCEWADACELKKHGEDSYVRGIHIVYHTMDDEQRNAFFCCDPSKPLHRKCSGHVEEQAGTRRPKPWRVVSYRQATSNSDREEISELKMRLEKCEAERTSSLCVPDATKSNGEAHPGLAGLAGLSGLAGISGIALIKNAAPCCCPIGAGGTDCNSGCTACDPNGLYCVAGLNKCQ